MRTQDNILLALSAVRSQRLRSFLTTLGIAVGIASVVLLTAIGEGIHRFVLAEFTQFGTHLLSVSPGRTTTHGLPGAVISNVRPLSLSDSEALRHIPQVLGVVPVVQGNAAVEVGNRSRRATLFGVGSQAPEVWQFKVALGQFLPADDPINPRAFVVLGSKVRSELFGHVSPLGEIVRIGGFRYRVIGVMESKGQLLGFDLDDAIYLPTARAMEVFNRESLMEIDVLYATDANPDTIADRIKQVIKARHGADDITIVTQEEMLKTLNTILNALTLAVGAIGSISLLVGGIGILTIMTIAVTERTDEIGLLRALGAERRQIQWLFLSEAVTLGMIGGLAGMLIGVGGSLFLHWLIPALPTHISTFYLILAELVAVGIGLLAGLLPARRAARLDPIEALRAE